MELWALRCQTGMLCRRHNPPCHTIQTQDQAVIVLSIDVKHFTGSNIYPFKYLGPNLTEKSFPFLPHTELTFYSQFFQVMMAFRLVGWLVLFNVPSTARSFRDGTPIYCPLRRTWSSINTPFRPGIEPRAVARQSITLPLRYASSTWHSEWSSLEILL